MKHNLKYPINGELPSTHHIKIQKKCIKKEKEGK